MGNTDKKVFEEEVNEKARRKLKARSESKQSVWAGFGLFGIIGWSVVVPTLLGAALGRWLDRNYPQHFSWTLTFLLIGLLAGCVMAWGWVKKEHSDMHKEENR
ncbi:MAG: F0F1 ATP synthase subunit [Bacteroidetes bacterium]|nr:F0F1 ATP synthase subunit [Bacteroidota bacterium]